MATLNPYINFQDTADEALDFYHSVFGGELSKMTFGENGMNDDPAEASKIMHGQITTPGGFTLMVADTPSAMGQQPDASNISISLSGPATDEAELRGYWDKLAEGGNPFMPLNKAPWGDVFGMLTDKHGVTWLVNIAGS